MLVIIYVQSNGGLATQRHSATKHRRIVSDTSALHLPMSEMLHHHHQQQQNMLTPVTASVHHDAVLRYVVIVRIIV